MDLKRVLLALMMFAGVLTSSLVPTVAYSEPSTDTGAKLADKVGKQSLAFFGFRFINSSIEPASDAELKRVELLNTMLKEKFVATGEYTIVDVPKEILEEIEKGQDLGQCECEADFGKRVGAQVMGWGTVEKVSNLILNINVYIADVKTNKYLFVKTVDIRGNDDTSWTRGLRWMLRYYINDVKKK